MNQPPILATLAALLLFGVAYAAIVRYVRRRNPDHGFTAFWVVGGNLAIKRTWLTVVIGVGVDMALLLLVLDIRTWSAVAAVIAASSVGIIGRSLYNEHADDAN